MPFASCSASSTVETPSPPRDFSGRWKRPAPRSSTPPSGRRRSASKLETRPSVFASTATPFSVSSRHRALSRPTTRRNRPFASRSLIGESPKELEARPANVGASASGPPSQRARNKDDPCSNTYAKPSTPIPMLNRFPHSSPLDRERLRKRLRRRDWVEGPCVHPSPRPFRRLPGPPERREASSSTPFAGPVKSRLPPEKKRPGVRNGV